MRVATISLKRTPERWNVFLERNQLALSNCEVLRIDGVDGSELLETNISTRLITQSAHQCWSPGAVGIGLSHMICWRLCSASQAPLVVLEDDVFLAPDWHEQLKSLLHPGRGMVLLGWNLDSMLRAEFNGQQEMVSLFEPAYPNEDALRAILNSDETRLCKRLRHTFGLPGYWVAPKMAERLLKTIKSLETLPLRLGRGFPKIETSGIDGLLNLHYREIGAEVVIPPLALSKNDQLTSLTRNGPNQFK